MYSSASKKELLCIAFACLLCGQVQLLGRFCNTHLLAGVCMRSIPYLGYHGTVGLCCPVVWLDGHLSEEGNPCFHLGMGAHCERGVWKEPWRTPCRWMSDLSRLDSASCLSLARDQCVKDNKPNKLSGTNHTSPECFPQRDKFTAPTLCAYITHTDECRCFTL